jgi:hypothetical protein
MSRVLAASASAPLIDWTSLGKVALASSVFAIGVVIVFSLGVVGLSQLQGSAGLVSPAETPGQTGSRSPALDQAGRADRRAGGLVLAAACFTLCVAAVGYGIWLIVPQFH